MQNIRRLSQKNVAGSQEKLWGKGVTSPQVWARVKYALGRSCVLWRSFERRLAGLDMPLVLVIAGGGADSTPPQAVVGTEMIP